MPTCKLLAQIYTHTHTPIQKRKRTYSTITLHKYIKTFRIVFHSNLMVPHVDNIKMFINLAEKMAPCDLIVHCYNCIQVQPAFLSWHLSNPCALPCSDSKNVQTLSLGSAGQEQNWVMQNQTLLSRNSASGWVQIYLLSLVHQWPTWECLE